jgi:integrase/recombinase XerD
MTANVDDVHAYDSLFIKAMQRLEEADFSDHNKQLLKKFIAQLQRDGLAKSTRTNYLNQLTRMIKNLKKTGFIKNLDELDKDSFDGLLTYLDDIAGLSQNEIRNYKKVTKKLFKWLYDDEPPRWVTKLKLETIESLVQPSDLLTQEEVDKLLGACRHPRNKAFISVMLDSGMRVGALASCRIKNVEFNQYGAIIYISKTSRSKKATEPKGIPITWSTGYLNQWLSVHPMQNEPEAPLWTTINEPYQPLSYKTIRLTIKKIARDAGIKKRVNPHSFRHKAITGWILDGLNDQQVKHRAGWSKGSMQMLRIYANFTDDEMNNNIFELYGLKTEDKRQVTLEKCPRCNNILKPSDRFCSQCSLVLDQNMAEEIKMVGEKVPDALTLLMADPVTQALIADKMTQILEG